MNLRSLISASMLVMVGMMAGRVLGMVREMMIAAHFGTGNGGDTAITLLMIPDFVTAALIGSALSNALVPAFAALTPERARALLWQAMVLSVATFGVAIALLSMRAEWLLGNFTSHAITPQVSAALALALYAIPFAMATAVLTAYLQYKSKLLVPAFATVIFNLVIIATLWLGTDNLHFLGLGILAASAIRFAPHVVAVARTHSTALARSTAWEIDRKLLRIYLLTVCSGLLGLLPIYAPYGVVAAFGDSIAVFNYAFKLVLLPGLIGQTIIQLVLMPWLVARRHAKSAKVSSGATVSTALQAAWAISFSMTLSLCLAAQPIAMLFFGYGKMTPEDIVHVGSLFAIGVWAFPAMVLTTVWQVIFYSEERALPPLIANSVLGVLIIPACWLGYRSAGLEGLLASLALLQFLCLGILAVLGYRSRLSRRRIPQRSYFTMTFVIVLVSAPFAYLLNTIDMNSWVCLALAIVCGALSLGAAAGTSPIIRHQLTQYRQRKALSN